MGAAGLSALGGLVLGLVLALAWHGARARQNRAALLNWIADDEEPLGLSRPLPAALEAPLRSRLDERIRRRREAQHARERRLERLWRMVGVDAQSALHSRRSFIARLDLHLGSGVLAGAEPPQEPVGALLLIKVQGLERLNRVEGRAAGDGLIASIGATLRTYQDRVPGALAGRLAGADFGLLLPVTGLADETAHTIQGLLQAVADTFSARVCVSVGAAEGLRALDASRALGQADAALRQAQMGPLVCVLADSVPTGAAPGVDAAELWRQGLAGQGDLELGCAPTMDAAGRRQGLLCDLRLRSEPDGKRLYARRWRSGLQGAGLMAATDLALLTLALRAVADGVPRTLEMDVESLREPGFLEDVARRLASQPALAPRLVLELDTQALANPGLLDAAAAAWRGVGAAVGLVHRDGPWVGLGQAAAAGVSRLAIDLRWMRRGAADPAVLACAWQAVDAARALDWVVGAREVCEPEDLPWIWEAGFDTVSGTALAFGDAWAMASPSTTLDPAGFARSGPQAMSAKCSP